MTIKKYFNFVCFGIAILLFLIGCGDIDKLAYNMNLKKQQQQHVAMNNLQ